MGKVSIVIPALNERDGIQGTVKAIPVAELNAMGYQVQIVVVDNGSDDGTGELARAAGAEVVREERRGYGYAYKAGFAAAQGDIIATADADLTYPVKDVPGMVKLLIEDNLDFLTTNRFARIERGSMSQRNMFGNRVLNIATRALFRVNFVDSQSGMWVFRRSILDSLVLRSNGMPLSEELKIEACHYGKFRCREIPITYRSRAGKVKLRAWRDGLMNLGYIFKKRLRR